MCNVREGTSTGLMRRSMHRLAILGILALLVPTVSATGQEGGGSLTLLSITPSTGSPVDSNTVVMATLSYRIQAFEPKKFIYTISTFAQNNQHYASRSREDMKAREIERLIKAGTLRHLRVDPANTAVLCRAAGQVVVRTNMAALWHRDWIARPFQLSYYLFKTPLLNPETLRIGETTGLIAVTRTESPIAEVGPVRFVEPSGSSGTGRAGVRVEFAYSTTTTVGKQPPRSARWTRTVEIDGSHFRIISASAVETSLDDGATTYFGSDRARTQAPLRWAATDTSGLGRLLATGVEDEKLTVGAARPGPTLAGVVTKTYPVDYSYVTVVGRRTPPSARPTLRRTLPATEHYEISVGDIRASAAAVRVILSRGFGGMLAQHEEAFRGFPLRIDGHLVQGNAAAGFAIDFRLEAVSIKTWSPPSGK